MELYDLWTSEQFERELNKTSFSERTKDIILNRWYDLDESEEFDCLERVSLQDKVMLNYKDPIASGAGYGQKDIIRKLKNMGI